MKTLVIAEAGVNHNGDPALAHQLIEVAAAAGADLVKFQTFSADRLVSEQAPKADTRPALPTRVNHSMPCFAAWSWTAACMKT